MNSVALINISGNIAYENDSIALLESFFSEGCSDEYAGILLWLNSGGGSFCVAQETYETIIRSKLPCVAIIGELCASAAYYIALSANRIIARPASLVGGLCASLEVANYAKLHEKLGVHRSIHSHGQLKQMLSPHMRTPIEGEDAAVKDILDDLDYQFRKLIVQRRPQGTGFEQYYDGRLLSGMRAQRNGLVDELGGLFEATQTMAKMLNTETVEITSIQPWGSDALPKNSTLNLVSTLMTALHI